MKSKHLLLTLLMALLVPWAASAQETVTIGEGTATCNTNPIGTYYNYSITEQLYTADEIGMAGTISSISFYYMGLAAKDLPITVYMKHVDNENLASAGISLADAEEVFSGTLSVTTTAGWVTIDLDSPFDYDGSSNLLIGCVKDYLYYFSGQSWQGTSTSSYMARYTQNDNSAYTTGTTPGTAQTNRPNIQMVITPSGSGPTCPKPTNLAVTNILARYADFSWDENGEATAWQYCINDDETSLPIVYTNSFTIGGFLPETTYTFKVRSACGGDEWSNWSNKVSFTTLPSCFVPTQLSVTDISAYMATVSWTDSNGADTWQICFNNDETDLTTTHVTTNPFGGLTPATTYNVKVRAVCGEDDYSAWTSNVSFTTAEICPDGMVCIGTGTSTSNYMPANNYYKYSLTEQIYTAAEIGEAGAILSIDYYKASTTGMNSVLDIYIVSTDKTEFESTSDWITVTASDLVYSGTVSFTDNAWTTIELDNPFIYDGVSNICIVVDNNTGSYASNTPFYVFSAENNQALYYQSDSNNLDPTTAISQAASGKTALKNRVRLSIGEPPACPKPTGVTASDVTAHAATISWTSDASAWQIQLGEEDAIDVTEPTYTFTGLAAETTYAVKVRANCGGTYSEWANGSFTTTIACPAPTVAVSNITPYTAEVSCTNTAAENFNVMLDSVVVAENIAMPYMLTDLEHSTTYTVKVQAICGGEDGESAWASATFMTAEICPEGMVCIGTGTNTNQYVPTYTYYNYSLTQQIYTATEIGQAGEITSVDFYKSGTNGSARTLDIYMVSTEKETFSGATDWIAVTASDLVYSGSVTFANDTWTTIEFNTPFLYDGMANVALIVDDNTGSYVSAPYFYAFDATSQAIRVYSDGTNYDPYAPSSYSGTVLNVKNRIRLSIGEPPACPKPTAFAVNYEGGTEAIVTWEGEATSYNIDVNGIVTEGVTSPYILEGLELGTTYAVMVQSNCGDDQSDWAGPISFTTDMCLPENMCEISYVLNDSYGDGWNGNAINVVDAETEEVLATWTLSSGSTGTGTLAVCEGRELQFVWVTGSYANETSYIVTDVNGEVIFEGTGALSEPVNYTVSCTPPACPKPTGLTYTYNGGTSVDLEWNSDAEHFHVCINGNEASPMELTGGSSLHLIGLSLASTYTVKVRTICDDDMYSDWSNEISFTTDMCLPENMCEITFALTDSYGDGWNGAYIEVVDVLTSSVLGQFTISNGSSATYTLSVCDGREIQFVWHNGSYDSECSYAITDLNGEVIVESTGGGFGTVNYTVNCTIVTCLKPKNLAVQGTPGKTSVELTWTPGTEDQNAWRIAYMSENDSTYSYKNVTSNPYTLNGLMPETEYTVKVRANCGGGDYSSWSNEISFTTAEACPTAINNFSESNITTHNALLSWSGEYNGYQVRYKKPTETEWSNALSTNEPSISLTGLEAGTTYEYQVKGYCSDVDAYSEWVDSYYYFTTQSICGAPQNLYAVPGIDNATISWTGYQTDYTVAFGETVETVTGTSYFMEGLTASTEYTVTVTGMGTECGEYLSADLTFTTGAGWSDPSVWGGGAAPEPGESGTIEPNTVVVIEPGETIEVGELTVGDGSYIVIEPGAELQYSGDTPIPVVITFNDEEEAKGPGCREALPGGYKLIAPPVYTSETEKYVTVESTHLMDLPDDFYANDLYSFDLNYPRAEWRNYKADQENFKLNWKQGYLYFGEATANWTGWIVGTVGKTEEIALNYNTANTYFPGLNLIGNPFIVKGYPSMEFYVLNTEGNEVIASEDNFVKAAKGFFVVASEPGQTCTVSTDAPAKLRSLNITLSQECEMIDAAAIRFNDTKNLAKIQLNPNHTKIYMPFEGKNYAILQGEGLGEMPINFEAEANGTYTLNFANKEVSFSYLHLIDNLTGVETNLLANPSYSFEAKTSDYASRFRLVYATGSSVDGDNFGFINSMGNLSIYGIEGEATLQVIDVLGHILSTETFSGSYERKLNVVPGVYMIRLIQGNDVKVQKMVVR